MRAGVSKIRIWEDRSERSTVWPGLSLQNKQPGGHPQTQSQSAHRLSQAGTPEIAFHGVLCKILVTCADILSLLHLREVNFYIFINYRVEFHYYFKIRLYFPAFTRALEIMKIYFFLP